MSNKPLTAVYFPLVQALPDGSAVFAAHLVVEEASPTQTLLVHLQDERWMLVGRFLEAAASLCRDPGDATRVIVLGRDGFMGSASVQERRLVPLSPPPREVVGYYEDISAVPGVLAVCGVDHVVQLLRDGRWETISALPRPDVRIPPSDFLLHIEIRDDGGEVVVCGSKGFLGFWGADGWLSADTGTNMDLNAVLWRGRDEVLVCGGGGMLLRVANRRQVRIIAEEAYPDAIFWDLEEFRGKVYVAAGAAGLYRLTSEELSQVETPFPEGMEVYRLSAGGDVLWAAGDEFAYRFDGAGWTRHLSPANR